MRTPAYALPTCNEYIEGDFCSLRVLAPLGTTTKKTPETTPLQVVTSYLTRGIDAARIVLHPYVCVYCICTRRPRLFRCDNYSCRAQSWYYNEVAKKRFIIVIFYSSSMSRLYTISAQTNTITWTLQRRCRDEKKSPFIST